MKRILIIIAAIGSVYGILTVGTILVAQRFIHPLASMTVASTKDVTRFQGMYDEFCHADEAGEWRDVYYKYMTPDFVASNSLTDGPTFKLADEVLEAKERTTWQTDVHEHRILDSVMYRDGDAIIRYTGHLSALTFKQGYVSLPYDEKWTAEDTWTKVGGKWMLTKSVALSWSGVNGGLALEHASIMPCWPPGVS